MEESHEIIKLVLLGDPSVGKTCYFMRYSSDQFTPDHLTTIGVDYYLNEVEVDEKTKIHIQLWDTAGQERFRTITKNYIKGAQGILLVFDITNRKSYENLAVWMKQIHDIAIDNIQTLLIGNKCDLKDRRQVSIEEGKAKANEFGIEYYETSAKENKNIVEVLNILAKRTYKEYLQAKEKETIYQERKRLQEIEKEKKMKKKGSCCTESE